MTHDVSTPRTGVAGTSATRALLAGGVVAGPLFIVVGLAQAFTRFARPERDVVNLAYAAAALHGFGWVSLVAAHLRAGLPTARG
jgi:hypothetical protein